MKKGEFISVSKRMVAEYLNRFDKSENVNQKITIRDVCVVGFHCTPDHLRILLSVPTSDEFYYEVVYDKHTNGLHSYIYNKVGKRIIGKRINHKK